MSFFPHSRTDGPLGSPCDTNLINATCYTSCSSCTPGPSCDWTSCHDDVAFTQVVLYEVTSKFCVDLDSIHMSGNSNGGMFIYTRATEYFSENLASVGPVCSAPLRGFNTMPVSPLNIIDIHGLNDRTIPYSLDGPNNLGPGPDGTIISPGGWYYHDKMDHLHNIMATMHCDRFPLPAIPHTHGWSAWVEL